MTSRRIFLQSSAAGTANVAAGVWAARAANPSGCGKEIGS